MAEHGSTGTQPHGFEEHEKTYSAFLKGSVALTILCLDVLVALVAFAFIGSGNLLIGFGGLIIGMLTLVLDVRAGQSWYLSVGWLVIFGLFTAVMLS
ncbi:aa3-type cytochrome c oxidase subunit IV [Aestuariivirga sp.]|uniref:aa3-type cytochrome c oxidase subunit IV n=1 Tax=Aestuariivirga sp. TaxID=2650926 RepID=UPI003BAD84FB